MKDGMDFNEAVALARPMELSDAVKILMRWQMSINRLSDSLAILNKQDSGSNEDKAEMLRLAQTIIVMNEGLKTMSTFVAEIARLRKQLGLSIVLSEEECVTLRQEEVQRVMRVHQEIDELKRTDEATKRAQEILTNKAPKGKLN